MKKLTALAAALLTAALLMGGCALKPADYSRTVAATYGTTNIYMDEAMFWLRLTQWDQEEQYASLYAQYYGTSNMWDIIGNYNLGRTMGDLLKEDVMSQILQRYVLCDQAESLGVSLTEQDITKGREFVQRLRDYYADALFQSIGSPTDEKLLEFVNRNSLAMKVMDAVKQNLSVDVSLDECDTFTVDYFRIATTAEADMKEAEEGEEPYVYNEELANKIKEEWSSGNSADAVKTKYTGFATYYNPVSLLRNDTENINLLYTQGKDLEDDQYVVYYHESDKCWYVIHCINDHDAEATAKNLAKLTEEKRNEGFGPKYTEMAKAAPAYKLKAVYENVEMKETFVRKPAGK